MLRLRRRTDTLLADSLTMEENETEGQDDDRYSDELCPECGGRMTLLGECGGKRGDVAGCGYKATTASSDDKVQKVMHEFKTGKLRLPGKKGKPGAKVTSRKQALAIALSESRAETAAASVTDGSELEVTASFGRFDESKHRRKPKGSEGGGQFTVKENAAGRFEVVDDETGKKVAETTDAADAQVVADEKNAETAPAPEAFGYAVSQDDADAAERSSMKVIDAQRAKYEAERELRRVNDAFAERYGDDPSAASEADLEAVQRVDDRYSKASLEYDAAVRANDRVAEAVAEKYSAPGETPLPPRVEVDVDPVVLRDELVERSGAMGDTEFSVKAERLRQAGGWWPRSMDEWQTAEGRQLREEIARRRGTTGILSSVEPDQADAIVAAIPVRPPSEWFADPALEEPTPITVTADGQIYGHAALWGTCHIGNPRGAGVCVQPPRSQTDYSLFHLGELETDEGERVPVGQITLDTGHAPLGASARTAAAHYDDTGSVIADVTAGEDEHGIYFAGALRPDATPEKVRKLLAAKISGDWRGGELVGMLAVNVPGFPVPRTKARLVADASGTEEVLALVAAGIVGERELDAREMEIRVQVLAARAEGGIQALADLAER